MDEAIESVAAAWDREYTRNRYFDKPPVNFVRDILQCVHRSGLSGTRGLYLGCGNGRNYLPLTAGGLNLVGLDVSARAIAQLRNRAPELSEQLIVGTVTDLPPDAQFPVVIGIQVFQHGNRHQTHAHLRHAQERTAPGGLFCLRVNAVGTDIWPEHQLTEHHEDGGLTVRYTAGAKRGLDVHFFSAKELADLFGPGFKPILPLRLARHQRDAPEPGTWQQWEAIWLRPPDKSGRLSTSDDSDEACPTDIDAAAFQ